LPKQRDHKRDKAMEIYLDHNGKIIMAEIARLLDMVTEYSDGTGTLRGWKSKDGWDKHLNGAFQTNRGSRSEKNTKCSKRSEKNTTNKSVEKNHGKNLPNKNPKTNTPLHPQARPGNQNAKGNSGGGAPPGNKNALITGEFEAIVFADITDAQELAIINADLKALAAQDALIKDGFIRQTRMGKLLSKTQNTPGGMVIDNVTKTKEDFRDSTKTKAVSALDKSLRIMDSMTRNAGRIQQGISQKHKMGGGDFAIDYQAIREATKEMKNLFNHNLPDRRIEDYED